MAYMQSNLAFAGGIQELTVDELASVVGGTPPQGGGGSSGSSGSSGSTSGSSGSSSGGRVTGTLDPKTGKITARCADGQDLIITRDGDTTTFTCPAPQ